MLKKSIRILLCVVLAISVLAGCGNQENSDSQGNSASTQSGKESGSETDSQTVPEETDALCADEGTVISVAHCQGEYMYEKFYEIGDKFKEMTGIEVNWMEIPAEDWDTWCTAQYSGGTEPDVFMGLSARGDLFDQGKIVDLTDYLEQPNIFNGKVWKDCFEEGSQESCMSNDGAHVIAIALHRSSVNLYYNKDIMAELGLGTEPPATYSELFRMMEVAKEDGTYVPMSVMNSIGWNLTWLEDDFMDALYHDTDVVEKLDIIVPNGYLDDSEVLLGLKTKVLDYDDPRFEEYFRLMKEFSQYWNEDFNAASWEYEGLFNDGKALFNYNGGWFPGQAMENGLDINYGATPKPYVDAEFSPYGMTEPFKWMHSVGEPTLQISTKCEEDGKISAAIKFLQFMTDAGTGAQMLEDAEMLESCIVGVKLPEQLASLADVEYGDYRYENIKGALKFNAESGAKYWEMYTAYLDPSSTESAKDFVQDLKEELLPMLDEAIEEYTTFDVLSYVDQVEP